MAHQSSQRIWKNILAAILIAGFFVILYSAYKHRLPSMVKLPPATSFQEIQEEAKKSPSQKMTEEENTSRPQLNIDAPFYSQAPFGNWDFPWQEACEEASMLLAANVYWNHNWTREEFNDEILKIVAWQEERFGTYLDTTAEQNAEILKDYLKIESIIHENPTYEDVKNILNKGHFIIMFFAGKQLGNPYFRNGGPNYHVILIKGYKGTDKVITHDVGTKNGANYIYTWNTLEHAMHDYAVPIESGAKRMLEVLPPAAQ